MKQIIVLAIMALFSLSISAKGEVKTITFKVAQLECQNCEAKIKKNISFEKGVKDLSCDIEHRLVTIKYDDAKTTVEKLQNGFKKFGYTAEPACTNPTKECCKKAEEKCCKKAEGACCKKEATQQGCCKK